MLLLTPTPALGCVSLHAPKEMLWGSHTCCHLGVGVIVPGDVMGPQRWKPGCVTRGWAPHSLWEQTQGNSTGVLTEVLACTATRLSLKQGDELENSTEIQHIKPRKWLFSELIPRTCVNCSYCKDKERDTYSLLTSTQAVTGSVQQDSFTFQFIWVSSFHNSFNICKLSAAVTGLLSLSHIIP